MNFDPSPRGDEERRRLFRRMEWVFVYLPPVLALFVAAFGAAFLAWIVPIDGTTFWGRWLLGLLLLAGVPAVGYGLRTWFQKPR